MKIIIDPGHGEKGNPYPSRLGFFEGTQMWKLANYLATELEQQGFETVITRPRIWDNPGLSARGRMAAETGSVMFISLHSNAPPVTTDNKTTGSEVFYSVQAPQCKSFAQKLAAKISEIMSHPTRGAKVKKSDKNPGKDWLAVINSAVSAGCVHAFLVEHGFHTNPKDAIFLTDDESLKKLAAVEAEVITEFLETESNSESSPTHKNAEITLTAIMGTPVAKVEQMQAYINKLNPDAPDLAKLYITEGAVEGVRGDIAFALSCLETGNFTYANSAVTPEQYNYGGMGVIERGMKGLSFETEQIGVRAIIHHLKAYADTRDLNGENVSPRFNHVTRGVSPYVEWLGIQENPQGKGWAAGKDYGAKILNILSAIIAMDAVEQIAHNDNALHEIIMTVENGVVAGVFKNPDYWYKVLKGEVFANPQYLKIAFDRYHDKTI